jgi:hypothetical protein
MLALTSDAVAAGGKIRTLWCTLMHDSPTWPIHGHYACRVCGRQYQVPWLDAKSPSAPQFYPGSLRR